MWITNSREAKLVRSSGASNVARRRTKAPFPLSVNNTERREAVKGPQENNFFQIRAKLLFLPLRALDCSATFRRPLVIKGKGANAKDKPKPLEISP